MIRGHYLDSRRANNGRRRAGVAAAGRPYGADRSGVEHQMAPAEAVRLECRAVSIPRDPLEAVFDRQRRMLGVRDTLAGGPA